jgi:hypothetical protein
LLLALFLLDLAAGLVLFLPLVGRRNAGPKFYRLTLMIGAALALFAIAAHWNAHRRDLCLLDGSVVIVSAVVLLTLRYPKRLVFRIPSALLGIAYVIASVAAYDAAIRPPNIAWSIAGALTSVAIIGSIYLAMTLGHWYLVVRGMSIDPLKRLTIATLITTVAKIAIVVAAFIAGGLWQEIALRQGIFFWMRALWGLAGPLALFPMVWGTVRMRSTMAATGILYVDVVAVTIGEVLGGAAP